MSQADDEDEELTPNCSQKNVIDRDTYPLRVLAGAGTGKTTTMVWKIEDLVADGVSPDEILALTFTNKAAAAMQEKVANQLDDPERAYDITVTTYHSIAHQILSEHAYYAGLDPEYDIATEVERSKLVYQCLDDVTYRFTDPQVTEPDDSSHRTGVENQLETFISQFKAETIGPDELAAYLPPAQALADAGEFITELRQVADEQLYVHGNTTANSLSPEQLASTKNGLEELLTEAASCRAAIPDSGGGRKLRELIEDLETILSTLQDRIAPLDAAEITSEQLDYVRAPAYLLGQHGNPPGNIPEQDPRLIDRVEELVRDWQRASDLVEGYQEYEDRLKDRGLLDFDDLLFEVLELFEDEAIGPRLRKQYEYVVCDEFQDTDKAQFELVQELVGDANLFLVGDDDQAIYEWRGANPNNIREDIEDAYRGLHTEQLEHNYRSRPNILSVANAMIENIESRNTGKELDADREQQTDATIATITDYKKGREMKRIGAAMEQLVQGTAPDVTLDVEYGDMAVLVRNTHHAQDLLPVLERRDIPYELAGNLASTPVGIETVLAYLKVLADPAAEVPLDRVLLLRYRLSEADLDRLHQEDGSVIEALASVPAAELSAPDRARTAHDHLTELLRRRETHSLSQLYSAIKQVTNIEWFLTADERDELRYLDDMIADYDDDPIENPLTDDFIEHMRHSVSALVEDESEGAEPSDDAVTLLTVHKAKGLEFPVVFMPRVDEDVWGPSVRSHDRLRAKMVDEDAHPAVREEQEQRRVFHVGMTRAEDLLVLSSSSPGGSRSSEASESTFDWADIYDEVPETSNLFEPDATFPVWTEVREALPEESVDWNDATKAAAERDLLQRDGDDADADTPEDELIEWVDATLAGEVETAPVTELGLEPEALTDPASADALRKHSYSAIDRFETCQRLHYLTNVVYAFEDPAGRTEATDAIIGDSAAGSTESENQSSSQVSATTVGTIFHETAERAVPDPERTTIGDWTELASDIARKHNVDHVPDRVATCIANYHDSPLAEWDIVATERPFELNLGTDSVEDRPLVVRGYIDAIYKHQGSYYVVDYKTSHLHSDSHRRQALIYMLACADMFDDRVSAAYVYYLNRSPDEYTKVEQPGGLRTVRDQVRDAVTPLNDTSYAEPTTEDPADCRHCPHNSLPCSLWSPENAD